MLRHGPAMEHGASSSGTCSAPAIVAMRPAHLAPDHPELGAVNLLLGLVDVANPLAKVEVDVRPLHHILNLDERGVLVLADLAPLVAEDAALAVQRSRLT